MLQNYWNAGVISPSGKSVVSAKLDIKVEICAYYKVDCCRMSIFGASWLCSLCGQDLCSPCLEDIKVVHTDIHRSSAGFFL